MASLAARRSVDPAPPGRPPLTALRIDPTALTTTIDRLRCRIEERFPQSGLGTVAHDLLSLARDAGARAQEIARPRPLLSVMIWTAGLFGGALVLALAWALRDVQLVGELSNVLQGIDAIVSIITASIVVGFFLRAFDTRYRRSLIFAALHDVRGLVHVIDMHQLTKDPSGTLLQATASSPDRLLSEPELVRYLAYASELLSLTAKVAVVYGQAVSDEATSEAVNDIERTCGTMSSQIWQKILVSQADAI